MVPGNRCKVTKQSLGRSSAVNDFLGVLDEKEAFRNILMSMTEWLKAWARSQMTPIQVLRLQFFLL